jgi:lysophospholipase L1-like esterase
MIETHPSQLLLHSVKAAFRQIIEAPSSFTPQEIIRLSAQQFQSIFSDLKVQIKGSEHLPYEQGSIFIYNHLDNHSSLMAADNFQITLDSHFISGMLYKYYKEPSIRVARHSLSHESAHKAYYERFDYIRVYSKNFIPDHLSKKEVKKENKKFYALAANALENNTSLVFSPEGLSYKTEASPGPFSTGVFKLACSMKKQPKIVPLVMVDFDKLPHKASYKCQVMPAFTMADYDIHDASDPRLPEVVKKINKKYKNWIQKLRLEEAHFEREIAVLKRKVSQLKNQKTVTVFYGSSSIRLWKNMAEDLAPHQTLNLGFGGAFIHSLSHYFEDLFDGLTPQNIMLYLGGNDLTLGFDATRIVADISSFMEMIHKKFPKANIYNISIKPSFERENELKEIRRINAGVQALADRLPYLHQLHLYEKLMDGNQIRRDVLLQDGLHLNGKGYNALKELVLAALETSE